MMTGDPGPAQSYALPALAEVPAPPLKAATPFRNTIYAVLLTYLALGLMLVVNAAITHVVSFPAWALGYLIVLGPLFTVGIKDYLHYVQTGQWDVPVLPLAPKAR